VVSVRNQLKLDPSIFDYHSYYSDDEWPFYNGAPYYDPDTAWPKPHLSDAQIKKKIKNGFFWSPFVDRDDIKVTVKGGVATLTGTVETWIGWGEADKDAHKSGATKVLNRIKVKRGAWLWRLFLKING
jgi:hypothetical protein